MSPSSHRHCLPSHTGPHSAPKWEGKNPNKPQFYSPPRVFAHLFESGFPPSGKTATTSRCPVSRQRQRWEAGDSAPLFYHLGWDPVLPAAPLPLASPPGGSRMSSWVASDQSCSSAGQQPSQDSGDPGGSGRGRGWSGGSWEGEGTDPSPESLNDWVGALFTLPGSAERLLPARSVLGIRDTKVTDSDGVLLSGN